MKLRPCPFCGEEDDLSWSSRVHTVRCNKCWCEGPGISIYSAKAHIKSWNRRAYDEYITAIEAILSTLDLDKNTRDSINRAIEGLNGE